VIGELYNMQTSDSYFQQYTTICKNASENDDAFNTFRSNPDYTNILEHVYPSLGLVYLNHAIKINSQIIDQHTIDIFKKIDLHGGSTKYDFQIIGLLSPTIIRYFSILGDINRLYGSLDNKTVIEIGAGYGGQSIMINLYHNVKKYIIVDLPDVISLIKKFLIKNNMDLTKYEFYTYDTVPETDSDYLISNFAFSECFKEIQDVYLEKLINKSKNFYMIINLSEGTYTPDELKEKIKGPINVIPETPNSRYTNLLFYR
jgi:hypothetical protein